jgi:proteasome accessory factor A
MSAEDTGMTPTQCENPVVWDPSDQRLPKVCGADIELGNLVLGLDRHSGTGCEASRALLREIDGLSGGQTYGPASSSNDRWKDTDDNWRGGDYGTCSCGSQDWGRKFLAANGGCVYIDLDHLELCLPEVISAYDHLAAWHAMLRIARRAMDAANEKVGNGRRVQVLVNNTDGLGHSYGGHLNFLITRRAWDNVFHRKLHQMLWLAAYQVSSIVFAGQGKVGSENGAPDARFQLSQRADFFETLSGSQTTYNRPIVNSRDEALCGSSSDGDQRMARLHCIFYDSNLCHTANFLKVGVMQVILAMLETERINPGLILDDPVEAVRTWSHDQTLQATARLASGKSVTATELQMQYLEDATEFVERGGCEGVVPHADQILRLWGDTLIKLNDCDLPGLVPHLDWVLKLSILQTAMDRYPELDWDSPGIKSLDHLYSSLDPHEGIYWAYEGGGVVKKLVTDDLVDRFTKRPPEGTRAYTRAMLLRKAGPSRIDRVDWDTMRFKGKQERHWWQTYRTFEMPNPLALSKAQTGELFRRRAGLFEILDALEDQGAQARAARVS